MSGGDGEPAKPAGRVDRCWPTPEPVLPADTDPLLGELVTAVAAALRAARARFDAAALGEKVGIGADATPTMRVDELLDAAVVELAGRHRVNLLSEEVGFVDHGSATTLVVDPLDGSANAAAGVPLSCVAAVLTRDAAAVEALTCWLDTGRCWRARDGEPTPYRTSGRRKLDDAAVSLLRPHARNSDAWWRVARRAERVRILSSSCLEAMLVAEGATDAFADAGSDTHRIVDLAAAMVALPAAGGVVLDVHGRALEFDPDLTRRWSGVIAATSQLGDELAAVIRG